MTKAPLCLNSGSIEHTFINCQESTDFSTKTLGWFYVFHKTEIKLSNRQIVFNTFEDYSNPLKSRPRLLILLQKKYLYNSKIITKKPNLDEFVSKLFKQCGIENGGKSYVMHAFSSVFFLLTMSNGYKIHSVTFLFFIDCCKLMFTCYFILCPMERYLF